MTRRILLPLFALWLAACSAAPVPTAAPGTAAPAVPSPTDRPAATATATLLPPDLPAVSAPALVRVDFLDSRSGWAVAAADKG